VCRRGEPVAADLAVVEAHHALDDRDVGVLGAMQEQRHEPFLTHEVRVEVATRPSGGEGVIARVDVVGPHFVTRHGVAGSPQRRHQAGGDGRLAVAGRRSSDDESRQIAAPPRGKAHHSMPR
jgi:hypothetical protein